jgi:hypothetical protein
MAIFSPTGDVLRPQALLEQIFNNSPETIVFDEDFILLLPYSVYLISFNIRFRHPIPGGTIKLVITAPPLSAILEQIIGAEEPAAGEYSLQASCLVNTGANYILELAVTIGGTPASNPEFVTDKSNITIIQIM